MHNRKARRASAANTGGWGEWVKGSLPPIDPQKIKEVAASTGYSEETVENHFIDIRLNDRVWVNAIYQVNIRTADVADGWPEMIHLSIKRRDKRPVGHERFRDFQRIKNELVGPEHEGVEVYPAESRLADSANQYHIWVLKDGTTRFPFGFNSGRLVIGHSGGGAVQKPF